MKKHYKLYKEINWRTKETALGFHVFNLKEPVFGEKARILGMDLDIIFFHLVLAVRKNYY